MVRRTINSYLTDDQLDVIDECTEHSEEASLPSTDFFGSSPRRTMLQQAQKPSSLPYMPPVSDNDGSVLLYTSPNFSARSRRSFNPDKVPDTIVSSTLPLVKELQEEGSNNSKDGTATEKMTDEDDDSCSSDGGIENFAVTRYSPRKELNMTFHGAGGTSSANSLSAGGGGGEDTTVHRDAASTANASSMYEYDEDFDSVHSLSTHTKVMEADDEELTWRLDPSESLSDWTLKIISKESNKVDTYYVHKNMLAVGKRKSEYFLNVFKAARKSPDNRTASTSEIVLPSCASKVVPEFLDYVYSSKGQVEISTGKAVGLRFLAQYFGVKPLFRKVMEFIQKDLALATILIYYKDSKELQDEKIFSIAARHCGRNIMKIDTSHKLLLVVDARFFYQMMTSPGLDTEQKQLHVSRLLASYCSLRIDHLDDESYLMLTSEQALPQVHPEAALTLLEMEADLVVATSISDFTAMSSLQQRCIKAMSSTWKRLEENDQPVLSRICKKLPSFVVAEMLMQAISASKDKEEKAPEAEQQKKDRIDEVTTGSDHSSATNEKDSKVDQVRLEYEAKMEELKKQHAENMQKLKKEYETNLLKLRDLCVEKDKHLANYWQELRRFERVPNTIEGKIIPSGRLCQPSKMPEIGKHPTEGFVLIPKKGGPKFPVFFYSAD